jgi:hypothetical protein
MRFILPGLLFFLCASISLAQGLVPCAGPNCNWCSLIQLIQNLINYAIYLGVLISAIVFAYAGVEYMTQESDWNMLRSSGKGGKEYAKNLLTSVMMGLVIILSGWLVVDTLLKALVSDAKLGMWNKIECTVRATTEGGYSLPTNPRPNSGGSGNGNRRPTDDVYIEQRQGEAENQFFE